VPNVNLKFLLLKIISFKKFCFKHIHELYVNIQNMKLRNSCVSIAIYLFSFTSFSQTKIDTTIQNFILLPECEFASISFKAIDLSTNEIIGSYQSKLSLPTASTTKLFSTASALEILGPNYQPETKLFTDGSLDENGVLIGNIWIQGGGDPTLGSRYFCETGQERDFLKQWVDTLKKKGVQTITGSIIADGSSFDYNGVPDGWIWQDMGNYYGTGPSGICLFDNMLQFNFSTGSKAGDTALFLGTFPIVPGLVFNHRITAQQVKSDNSFLYGAPYSLERFGTGALPLNQSNFTVKGSLPDPEFQLALEFKEMLKANGIAVKGESQGARTLGKLDPYRYSKFELLFTHRGKTIKEIVTQTNVWSVNLFAEQLVCLLAYNQNGVGNTKDGLKVMANFWKNKLNSGGLFLTDGSGLSRSNGISAAHLTDLVQYMDTSVNKQAFFESLPVSNVSGTLKSLCKEQNCAGKIHAKSGTMTRVKSYAGYALSSSGKRIAFTFIVNNFNGTSSMLNLEIQKLFNALSSY